MLHALFVGHRTFKHYELLLHADSNVEKLRHIKQDEQHTGV